MKPTARDEWNKMSASDKEALSFTLVIYTAFMVFMGYYGALCIHALLTTPL